ncbi:MAG: UvrD-helicase domain-containing protein [Prosthecobacter sp.]|jgi:DNA helicase-2/ATP-dependent DNA helicase PcrA|uniref:ATP-dependent helicase n=1 Tax=Prosthecobacter sp. TaxID=1965333 RepID=UPI001A0EB52C|nr:UvrD-helicase domain-containing protein [Prosthecobacter sp.]MBE2282968.1 UvrD-helicase domain-containing protein [Prosthecobacter sp.]
MSSFTGTLNPQQREAATHIHGPLLILAGAGTGKTRVVTARIAHMVNEGIDPKNILAVTFTNKAATEMRHRVKDMVRGGKGGKVVLGTFHAFCARLLREFASHVGYKNNFVIYSQGEQESLLKRVLKSLMVKDETCDTTALLSRISKAKNDGTSLGDPQKSLDAAVMEKYGDEMRALNVMDFDDLLVLGVKLLETVAPVRATVQSRHHYVMVDEFQDTNSLQMRLLRALVPAPYNVCVVGDDDQSIYGWRGAEITNITQFEDFFPNPRVVKLEENYRSTTPILHTSNSLIKNNAGRRPKSLWSRNNGNEPVRLVATQDEKEEADMIAKEVESARFSSNQPWEDFAVLFRTNDQSRVLEQAFRQRKIPYRVVGARSFFDRREVKDILSYLNILHNPHDDIALLRVLNTPTRGIGTATAELARDRSMEKHYSVWVALCDEDFLRQIPEKARLAIRNFTALISKYSGPANTQGTQLKQMTEALILEIAYMDHLKKAAKDPEDFAGWENGIKELLNSISNFEESNRSEGLGGFLDQVMLNDEREDKDDIEKKKGVCLITLHASKGLEFPIVYLPGIEQGILPHKRSYDEGRVDEERRLFYVGITRAKQKLTISHTRTRMKWGQKQTSLPSPFLKELDRKYITELDYTRHMNETVTVEENTNFFSGLRAMLTQE